MPKLKQWFLQLLPYIGLAIIIIIWTVFLVAEQPPDGLGTDFYPIYHAGQALLAGENPYGPAMTEHFQEVWNVPFAAAGFAYPLPAVVAVLPIALLPLSLAIIIWTLFGTVGAISAIRLREDWSNLIMLPFLFMPLHRAIVVKQATLVWFAFIVLLLFAMRHKWIWVAALCIVILPAKPQTGLLFACAGIIWAWKEDRRTFAWIGVWGMLVWGGSFFLQPTWVSDWLASVARYRNIVYAASLLPWGLLLVVTTWRLPWYARLAALQVVLFPMPDVYSGLPLLLIWIAIGGPVALIGSSISWLQIIMGLPATVVVFWASVIVPLIICAGWHSYGSLRSHTAVRSP